MILSPDGHADRPVRVDRRGGDTVLVKRYVAGGAEAVHSAMCALWASPFGRSRRPPGLPRPRGVDPVRGEVEMQFLTGDLIGRRGDPGLSVGLTPDVGRLLLDLHRSGVRVDRRRDPAALVRSGRRKVDELTRAAGPRSAVPALARQVVEGLAAAIGPTGRLVVSHGDFSPRNVLLTASGLVLIDFDRLQMAEPARDISYWGAWHWVTGLSSGHLPTWQVGDDLAESYLRSSSGPRDDVSPSWTFYRVSALLRIVHGWSSLQSAPDLTTKVLREALRLLGTGPPAHSVPSN